MHGWQIDTWSSNVILQIIITLLQRKAALQAAYFDPEELVSATVMPKSHISGYITALSC